MSRNRKYKYDEHYFDDVDTPAKSYWLGFLYADGSINRFYRSDGTLRSMTLDVALCEKDIDHLRKFLCEIKSDCPIFSRTIKLKGKEYGACRIQINSSELCSGLVNLGCTPNKTLTIKYPSSDIVPVHLQKHFVRGFFDGDGCLYTNLNTKTLLITFTGMYDMLYGVREFLISSGVLRKVPKIESHGRVAHEIRISGRSDVKEIMDFLYDGAGTNKLDRKYDKFVHFCSSVKITQPGVSRVKSGNWIATIGKIEDGKTSSKYLGTFHTYEEAVHARKQAESLRMRQPPSSAMGFE